MRKMIKNREMTKNIIIVVLIGITILTSYTSINYRKKYEDLQTKHLEVKFKSLTDYTKQKELQRKFYARLPYNYLDDSDVNRNPIFKYNSQVKSNGPKNGITRIMAARIAEAIWFTQFGDSIIKCRPYSVVLDKNIWIVSADNTNGTVGSAYMEIDKTNGRIVRYIMGK